MTKPSRHIIRRQVLEVVSSKAETDAPQFQEQAKMIYNKHFLPVIERCFDKIDVPNRHIRLDSFVVDIDKGDLLNLDATWLEKALQKLEHNLMQALQTASSSQSVQSHKVGEVSNLPDLSSPNNRNLSDWNTPLSNSSDEMPHNPLNELLTYFLNTGQLPWWADASDREIMDKTVLEILEKQPQVVLIGLKNDYYRLRFMRNVSDETLILLCKTMGTAWEIHENDVKEGLKSYTNQTERILFWEKIFTAVGILESRTKFGEVSNLPELYSDLETNAVNLKISTDTNLRKISNLPKVENLPRTKFGGVPNFPELSSNLVNGPPQYFLEKDGKKIEKEAQKEDKQSFSNRASSKQKPQKPSVTKTEEEHLYIQNAGLVLLAAYLPMFFENLGWVTNKKFMDEEKAEMAVQALQYLADGQDDAPEFLLTLPKILCGFAPDALLSTERSLNDEEKEEADSFLTAILENTPELGLKTPDALRGSFLLRQGMLEQTESQWILHVEVETFDLILHKIPWNFQIIKLPWMKIPIFTNWALPNF